MEKIIKILKNRKAVHVPLNVALILVLSLVFVFMLYMFAKSKFFEFTGKPALTIIDASLIAPNRLVLTVKNTGGAPANITAVRIITPEGSTNFISTSIYIREGETKVIDITVSGISLPTSKNYIKATVIFRLQSGEELTTTAEIMIIRS
ncbi:MAG: hypothetical protein DRJ52_09625 [Thermoprotei archaeon]|nr:MAG: hypothetical protein DRJ52_09625 [Thermoprotei archaeon]